jgi:lysylphosphatidylglycerol synthetase-like protein (DUF2156 family)
MGGAAKILRNLGFGAMTFFGVLGGLFVGGEAFDDPGGWAAAGLVLLWVAPTAGLCLLALRRPEQAVPVFLGVTAAVLTFTLVDGLFGVVPRDAWGPVTAIAVFALGVGLGFLGVRRTRLAGVLLVVAGLTQLVAVVADRGGHGGARLGSMLGSSGGVVVLPLLVVGATYLVSAALAHEPLRHAHS